MSRDAAESDHKEVELLAYRFWEQRGRPFGSPDDDWLCAQQEYSRADADTAELPFSAGATRASE